MRQRRQPEKELRLNLEKLAKLLGWRYYFTYRSRRSPPGFLDFELVKGDRLIKAELKSDVGRPTEEQHAWIRAYLDTPHVEVYLWRPSDWVAGRIEMALTHDLEYLNHIGKWTSTDSGYAKCVHSGRLLRL